MEIVVRFHTAVPNNYGRQHWYAAGTYKARRLVRWAGTTGFESLVYYQTIRGMGRVPRFALQADSLIGSSPISSTKQLRVAIVAAESHKLVSKGERYPRPLPMPLLEYATTRGS